ncbi:MAG: hypothetical protein ACRYGK_14970 [Janthinobacterium lividum]
MKHAPTLEQERREILDRIHASRAEYRRKLLANETAQRIKARQGPGSPVLENVKDGVRQGLQSATAHPAVTITAVLAVASAAVLAKRLYDQRASATPAQRLKNDLRSARQRIADILRPRYEALKSTRLVQQADPATSVNAKAKTSALATAGMTLAASVVTMMLRDPMKWKLAGKLFNAAVGYARRQTSAPPLPRQKIR